MSKQKNEQKHCSALLTRAYAIKGNLDAVKNCIDKSYNLGKKDYQKILNSAALGCSLEVVKYLINNGVEPTSETLYNCFKNIRHSPKKTINGIEIIELLMNYGLDPNNTYNGNNAVMMLDMCDLEYKPLLKEIFNILVKGGLRPRIGKSKEYTDYIYYLNGIFNEGYITDADTDKDIDEILNDIVKRQEKHIYIMDLIYNLPDKNIVVKIPSFSKYSNSNKTLIKRIIH